MADISHLFGGDLQVSASGDLSAVDGLDMTTQRVIRRIMTMPLAYIWQPTYGAGLNSEIGKTTDGNRIRGLIMSQIFAEQSIAANPPPQITVEPILDGVVVTIAYTAKATGQQEILSFNINQ